MARVEKDVEGGLCESAGQEAVLVAECQRQVDGRVDPNFEEMVFLLNHLLVGQNVDEEAHLLLQFQRDIRLQDAATANTIEDTGQRDVGDVRRHFPSEDSQDDEEEAEPGVGLQLRPVSPPGKQFSVQSVQVIPAEFLEEEPVFQRQKTVAEHHFNVQPWLPLAGDDNDVEQVVGAEFKLVLAASPGTLRRPNALLFVRFEFFHLLMSKTIRIAIPFNEKRTYVYMYISLTNVILASL